MLPNAVPATKKDLCEQILVRHAKSQDATFVTSIGQGIAEHLNPDGDCSMSNDRARRRGLHLGPQGPDGMSRLSGWIDPETRAYRGSSHRRRAPRAASGPTREVEHEEVQPDPPHAPRNACTTPSSSG